MYLQKISSRRIRTRKRDKGIKEMMLRRFEGMQQQEERGGGGGEGGGGEQKKKVDENKREREIERIRSSFMHRVAVVIG